LVLSLCKWAAVAFSFGRHTDKPATRLSKIVSVQNYELYFCPCGRNSMETKPMRGRHADNIVLLMKFSSWHWRVRLLDPEAASRDGHHPKRSRFRRPLAGIFATLIPSPSSFAPRLAKGSSHRPFVALKPAAESQGWDRTSARDRPRIRELLFSE
jgi:hypothetical protein